MSRLDSNDRQIIDLLQADARTSNAELARRLGMAPSAVLERVRKLESRGIILDYSARLSPKELGFGLTAFILVRSKELDSNSQAQALADIPEVQEVHEVAGEDCFLIKARLKDTGDLALLLRERIGQIPGVTSTRSTIVLTTYKESSHLPVAQAEAIKEDVSEPA